MAHSMLVKQSSSFSSKHRILSLQICVCEAFQLTAEFGDWRRNACTLYKTNVIDAMHQWHIDKHITKRRSCCRSMEKAVTCKHEG